ncbi:MAG: DUF4157 domain-containing protein [Acidimicrobiales bacterium]
MQGFDEQTVDVSRPRAGAPTTGRSSDELSATSVGEPPVLAPATALRLQRVVGNAVVSRMVDDGETDQRSPVLDVVGRGGGQPLDAGVRGEMEARLGHDFSDVRVHTDSAAAASAQSVQARAYTVGSEIVFDSGHFQPGSDAGRQTLAHELTHVVQQRSGPVDGTPAAGGIQLSDPSDRFEREAEHNASRALSGEAPLAVTGGAGSVQRQAAPDEEKKEEDETVQGSFLQRQSATDEEGTEETPPNG